VLVAYFTVALVTLYVGYVLVPNYLQQVRGYTESLVGVLFSVLYMGTVAYNALTGRVSPRVGFAAVLLGPWLAMLVLWQIPSLPATCVAFALLGGISTTWPLMQASIDRVVEPDKRGMALGVIEMCTRLGAAAASATAGQLYDLSPKHDLPFQLAVAAIPLVLLIWLLLPKRYLTHDDTPMP
jgi:predicted MFS family arabinose efflux permease